MFSVIFEVHPKTEQWDSYLGNAKMLRPELEQVDGFVDNIRYRSLTRQGWILSLSDWRDEKSVVRWRTRMRHHEVQEKGRSEILLDYHLRVGLLTQDTRLPGGYALHEQRLDETEVGAGTTVTLIDAKRPPEWIKAVSPRMSLSGWASRPMLQILSPGMFLTPFWCPVTSSCSCLGVTIPLLKPSRLKSRCRMARGSVAFVWCATTACSIGAKRHNITPTSRAPTRSVHDQPTPAEQLVRARATEPISKNAN